MSKNTLHIVSFDVPYPPIYGGVIDVFYKIKALQKLGLKIILHTYDNGTGEQVELNKYCTQVYYYPRITSIFKVFSRIPFIIKTRSSKELINNLKKINAPILFEGLHTTFPLIQNEFGSRKLLFRAHNIEHKYYKGLSNSETNKKKKIFFKSESKKLKRFEPVIEKVNYILTISPFEQSYFKNNYSTNSIYVPAFHQNSEIKTLSTIGEYAFYHGDLRIADNLKSVRYLINIFSKLNHKLIIAGGELNTSLLQEISKYNHINFEQIKSDEHLTELLQNAHINVLPTFQKTGIKLKLINTLYNSRFCVVNNEMIEGTGLEKLCNICNSTESFRKQINIIFETKYEQKHRNERITILKQFDTTENAKLILSLLD